MRELDKVLGRLSLQPPTADPQALQRTVMQLLSTLGSEAFMKDLSSYIRQDVGPGLVEVASSGGGVPIGVIALWSGTIATIPSGWALCDGTNGTPNLRDRFIVGAGTSYNPGDTGGANTVALSTAQLPAHAHNYSGGTSDAGAHNHVIRGTNAGNTVAGPNIGTSNTSNTSGLVNNSAMIQNSPNHAHNFSGTTANTGSGSAHENRPPYYALAYIMKVS
jgi:microcystin-dependent protein